MPELLSRYKKTLPSVYTLPWRGRVIEANGQSLIASGPVACVGEACRINARSSTWHDGQVVGFREGYALLMLVDDGAGIQRGDEVVALGHPPLIRVGPQLLGRVIDSRGETIDGIGPHYATELVEVDSVCPDPFARAAIDQLLPTGIRAIDAMLPIGLGQRVGIFGGSGVGKSTLLGMMTRNAQVDVAVIGLIGERGREVIEFLDQSLGSTGRSRSVVVVATSDQAPLLKMRAALSATSVAEYFCAQGKKVLLILDSLTRFAMAAREVGLAAGEPPTTKGYTPSVFSRMARLVERAGRLKNGGSITAFYTVLMEGDDEQDPIADAARSFLDGHIMLSRDLAAEGWYPPIDILGSVSRLVGAVSSQSHLAHSAAVRRQMASFAHSEDLIRIGAYKPGADPVLDESVERRPQLRKFMTQSSGSTTEFLETMAGLQNLASGGVAG